MRVVYACDIGSTLQKPSRFAWVRCVPGNGCMEGASDIRLLIDHLRHDVDQKRSVAIGFESPLFIPVPFDPRDLSRGRRGETGRSFSAPAGGYVATLGMHQSAWILRELFSIAGTIYEFVADWQRWPPKAGEHMLFCWEAFVSGKAHSQRHIRDAATAADGFVKNERDLEKANAVTADPRFSLIHAVALWAGWIADVESLHHSALVIKPSRAFKGKIGSIGALTRLFGRQAK